MSTPPLFNPAAATERPAFPKAAVIIAAAAIALLVTLLLFATRAHQAAPAGTLLPLDPYAPNLQFTDVAMSESTSLSGGKSTFIDGHLRNTGPRTVTAITVQVPFRNDLNLAPQVETLPLTLIRTHQPYTDTQPVSAAPLAPGEDREFRLTFENINQNWNVQLPEIHPTQVTIR